MDDILQDGFQYHTNWCVITGAPSSGKTSVINALKARGYAAEDEVARELIEEALKDGRTLTQIRNHPVRLQHNILSVSVAREEELDPAALVFLDRGLPDSLTYFRLAGHARPAGALAAARLFRYKAVFIFDRLPIVKDDVRTEDAALADRIDKMLEEDYRTVGYDPIRVPVLPIEERADFVLAHIQGAAQARR